MVHEDQELQFVFSNITVSLCETQFSLKKAFGSEFLDIYIYITLEFFALFLQHHTIWRKFLENTLLKDSQEHTDHGRKLL